MKNSRRILHSINYCWWGLGKCFVGCLVTSKTKSGETSTEKLRGSVAWAPLNPLIFIIDSCCSSFLMYFQLLQFQGLATIRWYQRFQRLLFAQLGWGRIDTWWQLAGAAEAFAQKPARIHNQATSTTFFACYLPSGNNKMKESSCWKRFNKISRFSRFGMLEMRKLFLYIISAYLNNVEVPETRIMVSRSHWHLHEPWSE